MNETKTKVLFHIGAPKTGSTALQEFLAERRLELANQNVAYHKLPNSKSVCHWWFAARFFDKLEQYSPADAEIRRGGKAEGIWERSVRSVEQLRYEGKNFSTVILSAEQFFFLPEKVLCRINRMFLDCGLEPEIVMYVRDPVDAARSEINQKVKMGLGRLNDLLESPPVYPVREILERFVGVFGKSRITVKVFDRTFLFGGDVRVDFVESFLPGINCSDAHDRGDVNRSLCKHALKLADEFNKNNPGVFPHSETRDALLRELEQLEGEPFRLPAETVEAIARRSIKEIGYLNSNWGIRFLGPKGILP